MSNPGGANPSDPGQVPGASGGQVPPPSAGNGQVPPPNDQAPHQQDTLTPEQLRDALRKARDDAAAYRKKAEEYEAARTAAERAKMDEATRAKAELEDAKALVEKVRAHARQNALEAAVAVKAGPLGIVYPDLALAAIEKQVTFGDDDKPQNVDELLRAFIQSHPGVTSASNVSRNTSVGNPARPSQGTQVITQEQFKSFAFREQWRKDHQGQTLGEAVQKGQVQVQK